MTHTRRWSLLILFLAVNVAALSAQSIGGDPITSSAQRLMTIILQAGKYLGVGAIVFGGLRWMFGRGDGEQMMHIMFGGALVFGASLMASSLFPGLAP